MLRGKVNGDGVDINEPRSLRKGKVGGAVGVGESIIFTQKD